MKIRKFILLSFITCFMLYLGSLNGCSSSQRGMEDTFIGIHNTLSAMNFSQLGHISRGSLPPNGEIQNTVDLSAGACYEFVAIGGMGVNDIELRLLDPSGQEVKKEETRDSTSALWYCVDRPGRYTLFLKMKEGSGEYFLGQWTGAGVGLNVGPAIPNMGTNEGTCATPIELTIGQRVQGDTSNHQDIIEGTCTSEGNAPDVVYVFNITKRSQIRFVNNSQYDGALILTRDCTRDFDPEISCSDDSPDSSRSEINTTLDPGTYYIIVSGYSDARGRYDLSSEVRQTEDITKVCAAATTIVPGQKISDSTLGKVDNFQATCAGGSRSPDKVYKLKIDTRSRVVINGKTPSYDGAMYLRTRCEDPTSEIECNDDYNSTNATMIKTLLDPGTYFLYMDGYGEGSSGNFELEVTTYPATGGTTKVAGDTCADAIPIAGTGRYEGNTIQAQDNYNGKCMAGPGSPDLVYRFSLKNTSRVKAYLDQTDFTGNLYIQKTCGDSASEMECIIGNNKVDTTLEKGDYYLIVDGDRDNEFGRYFLNLQVEDAAELQKACKNAVNIVPNKSISGSTVSSVDRFQASCADRCASPDNVYKLKLLKRSWVRVNVDADYDAALYIRRDCLDKATELYCNDDSGDNRHALIETTLDAGTYYIYVDGFGENSRGNYTINVMTGAPH